MSDLLFAIVEQHPTNSAVTLTFDFSGDIPDGEIISVLGLVILNAAGTDITNTVDSVTEKPILDEMHDDGVAEVTVSLNVAYSDLLVKVTVTSDGDHTSVQAASIQVFEPALIA